MTATSTSSESPTIYDRIYGYYHVHDKQYVINGLTIEYKCVNTATDCGGSCGSSSATLVADDSKQYDGQAYAATVSGDTSATIKYYQGESEISAPENVGSYTVKMTYGDKTVEKAFTITAAPIDAISLKGTVFFYNGSEQTAELNAVTAAGGTLSPVAGTDYTVSGNKGTGDPVNDTQYTVVVTGQGNYTGTQTADWVIKGHTHKFECTVADGKLTVLCKGDTTCTIPEGTSLEIVCDNAGKEYDGQPLTAYIRDNTPSPATFESYTSGTHDAEVTWDDASANQGNHTASFKATVNGVTYEIAKTFTIAKKNIASATITLSAETLTYTAADQGVSVTSVKVDGFDVTYDHDTDSVLVARAMGTYSVKITANGNFTGSLTKNWSIVNVSGDISSSEAANGIKKESDTYFTTDNSRNFTTGDGGSWWCDVKVTFINDHKDWDESGGSYAHYTKAEAAKITVDEQTVAASEIVSPNSKAFNSSIATAYTGDDSYWPKFGKETSFTYLNYINWHVGFSLAEVYAAAAGDGYITRTMNLGAMVYDDSQTVEFRDYVVQINVNDPDFVLNDQYGNQVYPAVTFVAKIGNIKYQTLAAALTAAQSDETITLINNAEAAAFSVGKNVTVDLGGYGAAEATYALDADDNNVGAKIISTKAETVTSAATGFEIKNENNTYTIYRAHIHTWEFVHSGATLTANCVQTESECDIPGATTSIELTVTGGGDGEAPQWEIANKEAFLSYVNKFVSTTASVGEITYVRDTPDAAEKSNWYVGDYTFSCVVTAGGVDYTLTKSFKISKPEGGYTKNGWVVGSSDIRYNEWSEAQARFEDGDTVYYRGGNRDNTEHYYDVDRNLTLDFGGATLKQTDEFELSDTAVTMVIRNNGAGTLTLQNVTIQQPKATGISTQAAIQGKVVLGSGVRTVNQADNEDRYFRIYSDGGNLQVTAGEYNNYFDTKNSGTVAISGGKFWSNFDPTQYVDVSNHVVRQIEGDYLYEVVEHTHILSYTASGLVITCVCGGSDPNYCGYNTDSGRQTATLTANDAVETTSAYTGASIAYSQWFPKQDLVIEYYQGESKLGGAPTLYGTYTAQVTLEGATVSKQFTISPMQVSVTIPNADNATVVVKDGDTVVESSSEVYSVTHGNKITATYTAAEGYEPASVVKTIESAEEGASVTAPVFTLIPTGPEVVDDQGTIDIPSGSDTAIVTPVDENVKELEVKNIGEMNVAVPPQIDKVKGVEPSKLVILADATNDVGDVKVDISGAFKFSGDSTSGITIELDSTKTVTIKISGKADEDIKVVPELGTATGTQVAEEPFVVGDEQVAVGVKTIPGLTYNLLSGDTPSEIKTVVKTIVAEDTRIVLEAVKAEDASKFYKIEVVK